MKLILAIVSNDDAGAVGEALMEHGFYMTRLSTTGGFLRAGNTTLIVGTEDEKVKECIDVIGQEAKQRTEVLPTNTNFDLARYANYPVEINVGGATIFVLDVAEFMKL